MVRNITALLRSLNQDGKRLLNLRLAEIVAQTLRPQAAIERKVVFGQVRRDRTLREVGRTDRSRRCRPAIEAGTRFEHHSLYFHSISQSSSSVIHIIRVALPSPNAKQCPCVLPAKYRFARTSQNPSKGNDATRYFQGVFYQRVLIRVFGSAL